MFRDDYRSMNEKLAPSGALNARTLERMEAPGRKRPRPRRALTVAAALALAVCLSLTAVAAVPVFYETLFGKDSPVAEALTPQTAAVENNGISLEILGSMTQEDGFIAYFTLQDLDKADRLSDRMFLDFDVYLNEKIFEMYADCNFFSRVVKYDAESQTALCRMDLTITDGCPDADGNPMYVIDNADVKLVLHNIFQADEQSEYTPIELPPVDTNPQVIPIYGGYSYKYENGEEIGYVEEYTEDMMLPSMEKIMQEIQETEEEGEEVEPFSFTGIATDLFLKDETGWIAYLKPEEEIPVPGLEDYVQITKAAYANDTLFVQFHKEDGELLKSCEGHADFSISDGFNLYCVEKGSGKEKAENLARQKAELGFGRTSLDILNTYRGYMSGGANSFYFDEQGRAISNPPWGAEKYEEYKFNIPQEDLDKYEFFAEWLYVNELETDLTTEFSLGDSLPGDTVVYGPVTIGDTTFDALEVSPLGIYAKGRWIWDDVNTMEDIELICEGEIYHFSRIEGSQWSIEAETREESEAWVKFFTNSAPIDPSAVTAIRYKGQEIPLTPAD